MKVLGILAFLISLQVWANETFITRIHSVSWGETPDQSHLVKFQNARIGFFYHTNKLQQMFPGERVKVEITEDHQLVSVHALEDEDQISVNSPFITDIEYVPTELKNFSQAENIMDQFRGGSLATSECYDRAHVWAYEEYKRSNLLSMKAFLFFSDKYIRKYNYKWWFHVAPLVMYQTLGNKIEKVLDQNFADRPLSVHAWTNRFMRRNVTCQEVERYSQYAKPTSDEDCYVIKTNMYFWQPKDLEIFENDGVQKVNFFDWEISHALKEAFGIVTPY